MINEMRLAFLFHDDKVELYTYSHGQFTSAPSNNFVPSQLEAFPSVYCDIAFVKDIQINLHFPTDHKHCDVEFLTELFTH